MKVFVKKHSSIPLKNYFEKKAWQNKKYVCGIDEVGRGSLAGPLIVAAAILPINTSYYLLKDSKLLKTKERMQAANWIQNYCSYTIVAIDHFLIDRKNIYQATLSAMKKAFIQLVSTYTFAQKMIDYIIVDAMPLKLDGLLNVDINIHHFPHAESKSSSVAAASIIAKVTRDNLMKKINSIFPYYHFKKHKGYGTILHRSVVSNRGPSLIHRLSFVKNLIKESDTNAIQATIF